MKNYQGSLLFMQSNKGYEQYRRSHYYKQNEEIKILLAKRKGLSIFLGGGMND
jgi:hypothetical protein